jgi:hypothetical protein
MKALKLETDGQNYSLAIIDDNGVESAVRLPWADVEPWLEHRVTPPVLDHAKGLVKPYFPIMFRGLL